ncbi:Protein canopy-1 [Rhynchospora pubera]|uniref:Protein canopy-1 n=1 Tax=Rhynchospora pubera TaxID=906938 RepID=A0AAV8DDB5_9POAL|nr:Protein canopy-1 [Rhynchospora pubera]
MEKKYKTGNLRSALWLLSLTTVLFAPVVSSIDDKCAACKAVAVELEIGLSNEKPKNDLDMRYRLNSKGQREGKVIDYRVSELRVVDLLDGLCDKMQDYMLEELDSGKEEWIKVRDWDSLKTDKQAAKAHSKAISTFCGRLLEETEDELSERIKVGSIQVGGVSKVLCQDLTKYCISLGNSKRIDDGEL